MATSYRDVYSNASRARSSRSFAGRLPSVRYASRTSGYRDGRTTTPTRAAFFAAARIRETPPMSMFSMASSILTLGFATTDSNG